MERDGQFYYHADGLGSIAAITDANQNIVQSYTYDSYGMVTPSTRFISKDPISFTGGINLYAYTGGNPISGIDPMGLELLSPEEGQMLAETARTWQGTPYFSGGGKRSTRAKADCSGATWKIYEEAKFPYNYSTSQDFPNNERFKPAPGNKPQVGDVGQWNGHLLIYDPNAGFVNGQNANAWSARNPKKPFGPVPTSWWEKDLGPVKWFRYDKP